MPSKMRFSKNVAMTQVIQLLVGLYSPIFIKLISFLVENAKIFKEEFLKRNVKT